MRPASNEIAPPAVAAMTSRSGCCSSRPANTSVARPTVTSMNRPTCSTKRKSSMRSLPTGSAGGCRKIGLPSSAAIAKNSSARGESRYSPPTLVLTISPTNPPSFTVCAVWSSSAASPNGLV